MAIRLGDTAPDFTATNIKGEKVKLTSLLDEKGQPAVVIFSIGVV